jgi:hypothetical protein
MFFDSQAWPPPPDGSEPARPPVARLNARQELAIMRVVGLFLIVALIAPFAGSSVVSGVVAIVN